MKAYNDHRKLVLAGTKSSKTFRMVEVKASMVKESGMDLIGKGQLMNKRFFCQWATAVFLSEHVREMIAIMLCVCVLCIWIGNCN